MDTRNSQIDTSVAVDVSPAVDDHTATGGNWPKARIVQWAVTAAIVVVAEVVFFAGFAGVSYLIDAVAVAAFFGLRKARE